MERVMYRNKNPFCTSPTSTDNDHILLNAGKSSNITAGIEKISAPVSYLSIQTVLYEKIRDKNHIANEKA